MHCVRKLTDDLYYIGASDRKIALFEAAYPLTNGVSYNSYLLKAGKNVLFDTADKSVSGQFLENLESALGGGSLDYIVVHHMEPDHGALLSEVKRRFPEAVIVASAKAMTMIERFFGPALTEGAIAVKEGDALDAGGHVLKFVMAPMVHWPEVMVTFDETAGTLFSADAFGTFGALSGNVFMDETDFERRYLDETRRYYTNIVGKYGPSTAALLKKASALDIRMICPLHGPVWRQDFDKIIDKYAKWAAYEPEDKAVMIACASIYGDTQNAADILAARLAEKGVRDIVMYDVSVTHPSVIVSEAFRCSHLVFAATTYNAGVFVTMETVLHDIAAHGLQNRDVAFIENGSWAPMAGKLMPAMLEKLKNIRVIADPVTVASAVKDDSAAALDALADAIVGTM